MLSLQSISNSDSPGGSHGSGVDLWIARMVPNLEDQISQSSIKLVISDVCFKSDNFTNKKKYGSKRLNMNTFLKGVAP